LVAVSVLVQLCSSLTSPFQSALRI
jgi:hypothetical protein